MKKRSFPIDITGATALEFALCAPAFFMLVMGIVQAGLLVWMQLALQQGVEAAARCASINKTSCATTTQIQSFASTASYGLTPPASSFTVTTPACGNQVAASYTPTYLPSFPIPTRTLTAQACFPS
jgi:Flp pilus assembly protein TadG